MPLSEEWLESESSTKVKESSITSWDLPSPKSWREDSRPSLPRESSLTPSITPEFSLDKDTSQSANNLSTSHLTLSELVQNNTSNSPPPPFSRPVNWAEPRPRRQRSPRLLKSIPIEISSLIEEFDEKSPVKFHYFITNNFISQLLYFHNQY